MENVRVAEILLKIQLILFYADILLVVERLIAKQAIGNHGLGV